MLKSSFHVFEDRVKISIFHFSVTVKTDFSIFLVFHSKIKIDFRNCIKVWAGHSSSDERMKLLPTGTCGGEAWA